MKFLQLFFSKMPYIHNLQHRNNAFGGQKSQWIVPEADELKCYLLAEEKEWKCPKGHRWGIHLVNLSPNLLGISKKPNAFPLHIAKFVGDVQGNWHGYPVAHWISPFDKPDESVIRSWFGLGYITRPTMSKIIRGKRCDL